MNIFQLVTLTIIGCFGIYQLYSLKKGPLIKIIFGLRWFFILLLAFIIIADPQISQLLARKTGISRGADLIIYASIIWLLLKNFNDSNKIQKLEKKLEDLVRRQALNNDK